MAWLKRALRYVAIGAAVLGLAAYGWYSGWFGPGITVLDGLILEPGDAVVALDRHWGNRNKIARSIGDFYVDDPSALKRIKARWRSGGPAPYFLCGYNYGLYLVSKGEVKRRFEINLERGCSTIVDEQDNPHWFDPSLIERFAGDYKKPVVVDKTFGSLSEGRKYLAEVKRRADFLMLIEPEWRRLDGTFRFKLLCDLPDSIGADRRCLDPVTAQMRKRYPGQEFAAEPGAETYFKGKLTDMEVSVACKEPLKDMFDLYAIEKGSWKPFEQKLRVVFKAGAPVK